MPQSSLSLLDSSEETLTAPNWWTRHLEVGAGDQAPNGIIAASSYPLVNGVHADMSSFVLPKLLRDELQFDRLVMSDFSSSCKTRRTLGFKWCASSTSPSWIAARRR
jgi:hypothetical protein